MLFFNICILSFSNKNLHYNKAGQQFFYAPFKRVTFSLQKRKHHKLRMQWKEQVPYRITFYVVRDKAVHKSDIRYKLYSFYIFLVRRKDMLDRFAAQRESNNLFFLRVQTFTMCGLCSKATLCNWPFAKRYFTWPLLQLQRGEKGIDCLSVTLCGTVQHLRKPMHKY